MRGCKLALVALPLVLFGCGGDKDEGGSDSGTEASGGSGGGGGGGTGGGGGGGGSPALAFTDANNYSYEAAFDVEVVDVEASTDATICWDTVTTDIRGRPMDPADMDEVTFVNLNLTVEEVQEAVVANTLTQGNVADYRQLILEDEFAGATCAQLSDFSIIGNPFVPESEFPEDDSNTWLTTLWNESPDGRNDILMSSVVHPVVGESNHDVTMTSSSAVLDFDADLHSLEALSTSAGLGDYTLDWSAVTVDVSGQEYDVRLGDRLLVGHIDATEIGDVESVFLRLFEEASAIYYLDVYGLTFANLADAASLDGTAFTGFTEDGIWLIGVECLTCTSPAPLLLTVVNVE
jgi:hypothetical protein